MPQPDWHPFLVDTGEFLTLQFSEWDIQSRMRKAAPTELVLSYTQAMMAFMLFNAAPQDVLIVGLGGGSLAKFCHRYLPQARITTLEISREVIALREAFHVPPDSERFRVIHADAGDWLPRHDAVADVLLLDGYSETDVPLSISGAGFYARCARVLTPQGILVANINLGVSEDSRVARRQLERAFARTISIRSSAGHNDILFAFQQKKLPAVKALKARARMLREETGVDFPLLLDRLRTGAARMQPPAGQDLPGDKAGA